MRKLTTLTIALIVSTVLSAQIAPKDSLRQQLTMAKEDTNKVKLLFNLVSEYVQFNTDTAEIYLDQSRKLIDKLKVTNFEFEYYYTQLKLFHARQEFDTAMVVNLKAIEIAKKNNNKSDEADGYRALFLIYLNLKMDSLAIQTAHKALQMTEELKDTANLSITFGNLSRLYYNLSQYDKAIEYGKLGIEAGKKYNSLKALLISMNNVAISYLESNRLREAEKMFKEQRAIAYENDIARSVVKALLNLCYIYIKLGDAQNMDLTTKELKDFTEQKTSSPIAGSDRSHFPLLYGYNYLFQGKFDLAEQTAKEFLPKVAENLEMLERYYRLLTKVGYAKHDYAAAERYTVLMDSISDIVYKDDMLQYEMDLGKKYETEKKESQIKLQQATIRQKNTLNYILIGGASAILIISLLAYGNYRGKQRLQQQRIAELETEKQLMASEALLKGEEKERIRLAKDLHDGLGGMLSGIKFSLTSIKGNVVMTADNADAFARSIDMLDGSIKEMRRVAHNMMPEVLMRYGLDAAIKEYCHDINQSGAIALHCETIDMDQVKLSQTTSITIYRVIQELLNNIMKHAEAKKAIIQISRMNELIFITVEDDGKGFDTSALEQADGMGWASIRNRIEFLKGKIDVNSSAGHGTSVLIELPAE